MKIAFHDSRTLVFSVGPYVPADQLLNADEMEHIQTMMEDFENPEYTMYSKVIPLDSPYFRGIHHRSWAFTVPEQPDYMQVYIAETNEHFVILSACINGIGPWARKIKALYWRTIQCVRFWMRRSEQPDNPWAGLWDSDLPPDSSNGQ